ncbi:MAG: pyridoxal-dependent decarboxylase [Vicingus serpentipes]|nr:pyridoxal-dependent decarboxylase [Vicingus serpentipes]
MSKELESAYQPENFRKTGHELIDVIADYLSDVAQEKIPVNKWKEPNQQLEFWKNYQFDTNNPTAFFKEIIDKSIHIHHPKYIGHQVTPTVPLSALTTLLSAILNNGMAVYEMGAASTAIEKIVVDEILKQIGYPTDEADGFITSGGTLATLTALLAARKAIAPSDVWENGHQEKLGVLVSEQAHYCVDKAARVMGLGSDGVITIPVGGYFTMKTELLDKYFQKATNNGIRIIAVIGSAPSTSSGMHDDLNAIAAFAQQKNIWFHVDGAHGGGAIFSKKYKHLLAGIEKADSIVIDGHKMLMMPTLMTFVLFKKKSDSFANFTHKADYLFQQTEEEWYNMAKRTFECTKEMMSIKFYVILKTYGPEVFDQFVTRLYDLGAEFAEKVKQNPQFELALSPHSNIVCFRYIDKQLSEKELNQLNSKIRSKILKQGDFYIVQTTLNGKIYIRLTFMNPQTTSTIMDELLSEVEKCSKLTNASTGSA